MKWSVVILILLGVVAAASASILVASLKAGPKPLMPTAVQTPKDVDILVAKKELPAMTVLDADAVTVKKIPIGDAPEGFVGSPVGAIGKLLAVPVLEGQALTQDCFATDASGAHLASTLTDGMRAISVSLTPDKVGLLYPGSIVDVLVSLTIPSDDGNQRGEAVVMTLLQGISVLAIDDQTILSGGKESSDIEHIGRSRSRIVTLKVDSKQAKALQLATRFGAVSLALRNPLDTRSVDQDTTFLSELKNEYSGLLARLAGRSFKRKDYHEEEHAAQRTVAARESFVRCELCQQRTWSTLGVCTRKGECREELLRRIDGVPEMWHVKIHRGDSVEDVSFALGKRPRKKRERAEMAAIYDDVPAETH